MELQSKTRRLEPAQAQAAHTLDRHISVTAGPGAGKTTVLVERYLHILREKKPASIDQIVAITFTNRAANEMRERLRNALDRLLNQATGAERERWMRYKRTLDGAVITTIHGFCMRLLREFPVEAGLDPQFMLLDEHRAATLLASAVEESLTESIGQRAESISRLTAGIGRPMLATALWEMYLKIRGQGLAFNEILTRTENSHSATEDYDTLCAELETTMSALISLRGLTSRASEKRAAAQKQWSSMREILRNSDVPLADYCGAIVEFREAARPDARGHVASLVKQLDDLFWGESKEKCFGRLPQMRFDLLARDYAIALVALLKKIDRRFTEKKLELSALDFDDLQLRALELLKRPEVVRRASGRYKFFLVDEFQDTNGLQRNLLDALALSSGVRANLFIVGDRKQSIYGFRGADVDVFGKMTEALLSAGGDLVPLPLNFRSQPPLINFFNRLFARFFRPVEEITKAELSELGFVEHELSVGRREARDQPPLVELMVDRLAGDDDLKAKQALRERDAQQLVQRIILLTTTTGVITGTAGVSPAPSYASIQETQEPSNSNLSLSQVEGGRDARDPGEEGSSHSFQYRDIALLFRAMTDVPVYEAEFRRAGIPFQTVLGKGFYEREEITDLIQLCRFLDNRTDELALAAILRSPLCGISDNTLLALRLGPGMNETVSGEPPQPVKHPRPLFQALRQQREIDYISDAERAALDAANELLGVLIERRNRYSIADLLRLAVEKSAYTTVIAATFDGAQRLANVAKLFNLAERFERSGAHLIRDFVRYVHDFEAIGSRESEGQLDDSANAVKLMTIHQAKGLEFPVVIIPDLHRLKPPWEGYVLLDRHLGLTLKVPNGRGQMVAGRTYTVFNDRIQQRESFENMRLLYVAATRARDRLILSGAAKEVTRLAKGNDNWLQLIWQALDLGTRSQSALVELDQDTQLQLTLNLADQERDAANQERDAAKPIVGASLRGRPTLAAQGITPVKDDSEIKRASLPGRPALAEPGAPTEGRPYTVPSTRVASTSPDLEVPFSFDFPLLQPIEPQNDVAVHRFSVTQMINYRRCPRQYYFDRVLHVPSADEVAMWNDAEAPEPPANLTATLKGAVIHRFCETYVAGDQPEARLRQSFAEILSSRRAQLADRLLDIDTEEAINELWPLAQNYLASKIFQRIQYARSLAVTTELAQDKFPVDKAGLWSELSFRLRRPLGFITGTIDKLLVVPALDGDGFDVEIVDFKTNRIVPTQRATELRTPEALEPAAASSQSVSARQKSGRAPTGADQFSFDFSAAAVEADNALLKVDSKPSPVDEQARRVAADYQLQMQAYALAVRELLPDLTRSGRIKVTLHFLQPDIEFQLAETALDPQVCAAAIDDAMLLIVSATEPDEFPVNPATHCRMCNFLEACTAGSEWLRNNLEVPVRRRRASAMMAKDT